jgi:hypothetical protein
MPKSSNTGRNAFVACPCCRHPVKAKNLKRHLGRVHDLGANEVTINKPAGGSPTNQTGRMLWAAANAERARRINASNRWRFEVSDVEGLCRDPAIADYLQRNPVRAGMGKFGVPQDSFRWGFYGHRTMEYDSWGRGHERPNRERYTS